MATLMGMVIHPNPSHISLQIFVKDKDNKNKITFVREMIDAINEASIPYTCHVASNTAVEVMIDAESNFSKQQTQELASHIYEEAVKCESVLQLKIYKSAEAKAANALFYNHVDHYPENRHIVDAEGILRNGEWYTILKK